jgi:hypothetical protein
MGFAAFAVDIGYAYYTKRSLQASADAAALAGAQELPDSAQAIATAESYSGEAGAKNDQGNLEGVQAEVTTKCVSIAPCRPVNAISVVQTATVETKFAKVLGIDDFEVAARSTACAPCGGRELDVILVLDRTWSMCQTHSGSVDSRCLSATLPRVGVDLQNAKDGIHTFLGFMDPTLDKVGLVVLPPTASGASHCAWPGLTGYTAYNSAGAAGASQYVVAPLDDDYKVNGEINDSSQLVSSLDCIQAGGVTAYATALEQAQAELDRNGREDVQDVIVFLSDGAANYGSTTYGNSSPYRTQPCRQGVNSAATIKNRGTLIYTIGYDLDAVNGSITYNRCQSYTGVNESPAITAYEALQAIASPNSFHNQPSPGELNSIYTEIAGELAGTRLIDESVQ